MSVGMLLGLVAAIALLAWLLRRGERAGRRRPRPRAGDIDWTELEAAEREVRDLGADARPDDETPGADWGPGTPRSHDRL